MAKDDLKRLERLQQFLRSMTDGMGRRERREALSDYLRGLMLAGERKSLQPMAARLASKDGDEEAYRAIDLEGEAYETGREIAEQLQHLYGNDPCGSVCD